MTLVNTFPLLYYLATEFRVRPVMTFQSLVSDFDLLATEFRVRPVMTLGPDTHAVYIARD